MTLLTAKKLDRLPSDEAIASFTLQIRHHPIHTKIDMNVASDIVNTRDIPWTFAYLEQNLPSILSSTCFNDEQIPFSEEVTRTELGHLFEHILLEYLCGEKLQQGCEEAVFSGRTNWNWEREPFGLFHIYIDITQNDREIFPEALRKSVLLFDNMLKRTQQDMFPYVPQSFQARETMSKPLLQ